MERFISLLTIIIVEQTKRPLVIHLCQSTSSPKDPRPESIQKLNILIHLSQNSGSRDVKTIVTGPPFANCQNPSSHPQTQLNLFKGLFFNFKMKLFCYLSFEPTFSYLKNQFIWLSSYPFPLLPIIVVPGIEATCLLVPNILQYRPSLQFRMPQMEHHHPNLSLQFFKRLAKRIHVANPILIMNKA